MEVSSLLTFVLTLNSPISANELSSEENEEFPFESSLTNIDAVRVYAGGVFNMYRTAIPIKQKSERINHFHLIRQRATKSCKRKKSFVCLELFLLTVMLRWIRTLNELYSKKIHGLFEYEYSHGSK